MPRLPDVLSPADLPLAELHAARLTGEVYAIGGCFAPVDLPELRAVRAEVISRQAPARFVADRLTAAWVWGAVAAPPVRLQFCIDIRSRHRQTTTRFDLREVVIDGSEIAVVGAALVTSPERTMLDLARDGAVDDEAAVGLLQALRECTGIPLESVLARVIGSGARSHMRRARSRLECAVSAVADAVDVVDALDAPHGIQHAVEMGRVTHLEDEAAERQSVA